ncbi:alpha/beta fold hydrolase [Luteimonas sp. SJ-92]|uniref:Alpha/beta fold hydrolase n=1 Tax=Luteimonas salinisoli TaxID=2752307 RepID=A0A853JAZ7_9GAMM|nr:alpha/beta fold hydrolase [Luteimonas salinisoli]NZA26381.1 alpha/beta fold hydrolase [Luteimonas salinisoli]
MRAALLLATLVLLGDMPAARADEARDRALALQALDRLEAGRFDEVWRTLAPQGQAAVSADQLERVWNALPLQLGPLRSRGEPVAGQAGGVRRFAIPLRFEHGTLNAFVAVDAEGRIATLLLQPAPAPEAATAPAGPGAGYAEREFVFRSAGLELPGTLALPDGAGPFPAVVLVHGSGPQDRDQRIGPNRPFRDIARGLAARGIAVLRYDKRTHAHPQPGALEGFTIDDETTDDAVAAVAAMRKLPEIDPAGLFVLGHSQGGMLAPRIARRSGDVAGVILLAAPSRPLLDVLQEQLRRNAATGASGLDQLERSIARLRAGEDLPAAASPLGLPAGYWRSVDAIDAAADIRALEIPVLLLHGGRDIQVTDTDWQGWRAAFGADPRATLKRHAALSHLGIAGEGPGSPADYMRSGTVDAALIADIADWIGERLP